MNTSLQEHLEGSFDVDVEQEIELAGHPQGHPELQQTQRFIVDDETKAEWALRKLARAEAELERDRAIALAEIEKVSAWLDARRNVTQRQIDFFRSLLREFHTNELASDPKRKTISLPSGTLRARKAAEKWVVDNEVAFIDWAKVNLPEAVRTREEAAKTEIKKLLQISEVAITTEDGQPAFYASLPDTGEIVPGVTVVPVHGGVTFNVDVRKDES
jgi:phage host-nuclease inhibitor protein Gam